MSAAVADITEPSILKKRSVATVATAQITKMPKAKHCSKAKYLSSEEESDLDTESDVDDDDDDDDDKQFHADVQVHKGNFLFLSLLFNIWAR